MNNIDEYSKHELLDRLHSVEVMFHQLVVDHPAASLMRDEIDRCVDALGAAYQKAGFIRFN